MRPVDKGASTTTYNAYQNARNDLCLKIGWYCSYCEMTIRNMPEVEHVIPVNQGGPSLDWDNFLVSCKYCNVNKKDYNPGRINYYWPDQDNTFRAFEYKRGFPITASSLLGSSQKKIAETTINLCGLDKEPGAQKSPTPKDTRWISRKDTWDLALESLKDWETSQTSQMAKQVARTAAGTGHFSIWMEVFKNYKQVRYELLSIFPGTDHNCFDNNLQPIHRQGGNL
ncbi:hypothetical protein A9490_13655 [Bacillus thuringiensis]|uniref:HNH endonuclease n=1 Tax=Bacillus thuringiensis TaxID=1428 RepID=UPI0008FE4B06|nr:HNH endonuclease [Bacillus thuringiensis]OJE17821.1 hypothetical protein A9490_13655 [Bacillus thuringiensis]